MSSFTEPDFSRVRPVRVRVRLARPTAEVFAFISDPANDPKWVDTTPNVKQLDGQGPAPGAIYEYEQTVGRTVTGTITITDMAAPGFMAFRVEDPLRIYRVEYRLEYKHYGCILEQSSYPWFKKPKLQRKLWIIRFMIRKQLQKQMRSLKQALA